MQITQGDKTATFTEGQGYASDDASFAFWLNSTFPAKPYADAAQHKAALLAAGLTVDGVAPPEPEPEPEHEETAEEKTAREAAEAQAARDANPFLYGGAAVFAGDVIAEATPTNEPATHALAFNAPADDDTE